MSIKTIISEYPRALGIRLSSGDGDEYPGCKLTLSGGHRYISIDLPQIISPKRTKVYPDWSKETVDRLGRNWYYNYIEREYGVTIFENYVSFMYGLQADDSAIDQRYGFFIPWMEHRVVEHLSFFADGSIIDETNSSFIAGTYQKNQARIEASQKTRFLFKDFDGETIHVDCYIKKYMWKRGTGRFKWVGKFFKPTTKWYVDLEFSSEVGRRKGSWKGGTLGHSCTIDVDNIESIETAFKRYCTENELTFIDKIPWVRKPFRPYTKQAACCSASEKGKSE